MWFPEAWSDQHAAHGGATERPDLPVSRSSACLLARATTPRALVVGAGPQRCWGVVVVPFELTPTGAAIRREAISSSCGRNPVTNKPRNSRITPYHHEKATLLSMCCTLMWHPPGLGNPWPCSPRAARLALVSHE